MTTIAYKDGIIAYDSRMTKGDVILDDDFDKMDIINDHYFFYAGTPCDLNWVVNGFFNNDKGPDDYEINCEAIVIDPSGCVWNCSFTEENTFWKFEFDRFKVLAIGSGLGYALTAMDCGKSAIEAVELAIKRDLYSGGKVKHINISDVAKGD